MNDNYVCCVTEDIEILGPKSIITSIDIYRYQCCRYFSTEIILYRSYKTMFFKNLY